MKKIIALALFMMFAFGTTKTIAQHDTIFTYRKTAVTNLEVFRTTITDSTLSKMKDLAGMQEKVLIADKQIIDVYLDSMKTKADSLKQKYNRLTLEKENISKSVKDKDTLLLYVEIGGGAAFLLFVVCLVLFFITLSGKNKFKKQVAGIDKIKEDNLKEIEKARNETEVMKANAAKEIEQAKKDMEVMKANAAKEIAAAKEQIRTSVEKLQSKIDSQTTSNTQLEKRITEKNDECTELQIEMSTLKGNLDKKEREIKIINDNISRDKLVLEKQIFDKELQIENLAKSKKALEEEFNNFKNSGGNNSGDQQLIEAKLAEKDNEFRQILSVHLEEIEQLRKEKESLQQAPPPADQNEFVEKLSNEKLALEASLVEKENTLNNIINENAVRAGELRKEINNLSQEINRNKEMFESLSGELKSFETRLTEQRQAAPVSQQDSALTEKLTKENDLLKAELLELKKQVEEENNRRKLIDEDLRRFIEELKKS